MTHDKTNPDHITCPDQKTAHDLMRTLFEYYQQHHRIVLKKLEHAQKATEQSLENVKKAMADATSPVQDRELSTIEDFNAAWQDIIDHFEKRGISQEELFQIEGVLGSLPRTIKTHYDTLMMMDSILQTMLKNLETLDYSEVSRKVDVIQNRPNPMSGLPRRAYEPENAAKIKVFSFISGKR